MVILLSKLLNEKNLEQFVLVSAELVAFLWRDASRLLLSAILLLFTLPDVRQHEEASEGATDKDNNGVTRDALVMMGEYLSWVVALFLFGLLWLHVGKRVRGWTVHTEPIKEGLRDIDSDVHGLAVGWTLNAAFSALALGTGWEEMVEKHDISIARFWLFLLFAISVVALAAAGIAFLIFSGYASNSSTISVLVSVTSFLCGFLLNTVMGTIVNLNQSPIMKKSLDITYGELFYPLTMLIIGGCCIQRSYRLLAKHLVSVEKEVKDKVAGLKGDDEFIAMKTEEIRENIEVKLLYRSKITVLAYQTCMALAFEELFDRILHATETSGVLRAFVVAAIVTLVWVLTCVWSFRLGEDEDSEKEEAAS